MRNALRTFNNVVFTGLEWLLGILMGVMTVVVVWQVVSRYLLDDSSTWSEEAATRLLIWVTLIGGAVALRRGSHLGLDYFANKLPASIQHWARLTIPLSVAFFAGVVLLYGGGILVARTLQSGQLTPALGVPMGYFYLALPVGGATMLLCALENLLVAIADLRPRPEGEASHG
jgi:TRAP-type C4-dicarboxylate transport system permease small subunit